MKTAGVICIVIGLLGFLGAAFKGNSVFGPMFFIAFGAFLLYNFRNKETDETKTNKSDKMPQETTQKQDALPNHIREGEPTSKQIPDQQMETLEDIQSQLTLQQREAAMCLISFFGGYNDNLLDNAPMMIFKQSALFFGIPDSPEALTKIMSKYTDADALVDIVLTIKPVKAKEFLLLTCYDLIRSANKPEAEDLLFNIANDMGYDKTKMGNLINLYQ